MKIAVSACLLGEPCRYDGASRPCEAICALGDVHELIPICPEIAGGLPIPHPPSEIVTSERALRVVDAKGADTTDAFLEGARETVQLVQKESCQLAILKAKSPSCGSGFIYDGTFSGTLVPGYGVAARALREAGIRVLDEMQAQACIKANAKRPSHQIPAIFATTAAECPTLETERLVLRPLNSRDIPDVFAYCSNPDIGHDAGWAPHRTIEDARVFVEDIAQSPHVFGVFERKAAGGTGPCIGSCGLIPDPQRRNVDCLMLGYALAQSAWGKGYMTEASREIVRYGFEELCLSHISCTHYLFNDRSRRVIEKCGFEREGTLHGAEATPDGLQQDLALYYLTRETWLTVCHG